MINRQRIHIVLYNIIYSNPQVGMNLIFRLNDKIINLNNRMEKKDKEIVSINTQMKKKDEEIISINTQMKKSIKK